MRNASRSAAIAWSRSPMLFEDAPEPLRGREPGPAGAGSPRGSTPRTHPAVPVHERRGPGWCGPRRSQGEAGQPPGSEPRASSGLAQNLRAPSPGCRAPRRTGVELYRLPQMIERSGLLTLLQECVAQVIVSPGEVGFQRDGSAQVADRGVEVPTRQQRQPEVVVILGPVGLSWHAAR